MIQELHDWEKKQRNREMLLSGEWSHDLATSNHYVI